MSRRIVLVPSPLLAADSWAPTATALTELGHEVVLAAIEDGPPPLWQQHAASASRAIDGSQPYVLVAHSGAGALLPGVAQAAGRLPLAAVYVDAGLPIDQTTRLEQLAIDAPDTALALRDLLAGGGVYPTWSDADLASLVGDATARSHLLDGVRPRGRDFFTEPIPVPGWWGNVPAGYVRLSQGYDVWERMARGRGWPVEHLDGGHFQLVDDPAPVARAIIAVLDAVTGEQTPDSGPPAAVTDLTFDARGLIPAIVQQHDTGEVLMMAWMNADTLAETMDRGETVFWSRSRSERWHKGATSGNTQRVVEVVADCDGDVVLIKVDQGGEGVACHTGKRSCFHVWLTPR